MNIDEIKDLLNQAECIDTYINYLIEGKKKLDDEGGYAKFYICPKGSSTYETLLGGDVIKDVVNTLIGSYNDRLEKFE